MGKKKLTLSIDEKKNVSEIIENYIRAMKKNKNIIKAIDDIVK